MKTLVYMMKLCVLFAVSLVLVGCGAGISFKAASQGAVRTMAEAVKVSDKVCAEAIRSELAGVETPLLGEVCVKTYRAARASLITAEELLDTGFAAAEKQIPCALIKGVKAMLSLKRAIAAFGVAVPPALDDALEIGEWAAKLGEASLCKDQVQK